MTPFVEGRTAPGFTVPAPALVLGGVASVQFGAAIAKALFDDLTPTGVVALRLLFGAIVPPGFFRPPVRNPPWSELGLPIVFGLTLAAMTLCFFRALDGTPLGIAVTLEFVGPLGVALMGSRRKADFLWVALAGAGIALLAPSIGGVLGEGGGALPPARGGRLGAHHPPRAPGGPALSRPAPPRLPPGGR